jgi:CubicO group peptidase (beta-lactamase class C family)
LDDLAAYAEAQRSTGLMLAKAGRTVLERSWPLPTGAEAFAAALGRGTTADGAPREDVASQQKAVISLLAGIAADRALLDVEEPVSAYIGAGWTKAGPDQERLVTVGRLLEMNSGLSEALEVEAPPGARFFYNTPAYARLQRVLEAVGGQALGDLSRAWLTGPLGMTETAWRPRPPQLAESSGNAWGLVTVPADLARLGRFVLDGGVAPDGARLISPTALAAIFAPTPTNPAFGRLWWLNGGAWSVDAQGARKEGRLAPTAPPDLVLALGAHVRVLGVIPSLALVVVRMGPQPPDADFLPQLLRRVVAAAA